MASRARGAAASEETLSSKDGVTIFVRSWEPAPAPRAVVVICHGLNAHSGLYAWAAAQLAAAGFAVFALDLRGRGRSEGERFLVRDIADYVADVHTTVMAAKSRHPGLPVFLLGHSAGGVTACVYALDHGSELAGLISESFAFRVPAPMIVLTVMKSVSGLIPRAKVLRLKSRDFSRDPQVVAALDADPLIANEAQPAATIAALVRANDRLLAELGRITLPVLILHGTADKVTLPAGSQLFFDRAGSSDKQLKLYDGHVHDLLADYGKEGVIADIIGWIDQRVPAAA
ncbi:MAG: lysophospholipase [Bauldia sp.]|nr:lysophospholipase [Bauldia sp.]